MLLQTRAGNHIVTHSTILSQYVARNTCVIATQSSMINHDICVTDKKKYTYKGTNQEFVLVLAYDVIYRHLSVSVRDRMDPKADVCIQPIFCCCADSKHVGCACSNYKL